MENYYNMSSLFIWYKVFTKKLVVVTLIETYIQIVIGWYFIQIFASSTFERKF